RVLPGVPETLARRPWPVRRLINEDLPTLDRPIKANSGRSCTGQAVRSGALEWKTVESIFIARLDGHVAPLVQATVEVARPSGGPSLETHGLASPSPSCLPPPPHRQPETRPTSHPCGHVSPCWPRRSPAPPHTPDTTPCRNSPAPSGKPSRHAARTSVASTPNAPT